MKSLRESLNAGERIPVPAEKLKEALENVKNVGIHYQLKELVRAGVLEERQGTFKDSTRYFYRNRPVKIHASYTGTSTWKFGDQENMEFKTPYDIVIDKKTKQIICMAKAPMSYFVHSENDPSRNAEEASIVKSELSA